LLEVVSLEALGEATRSRRRAGNSVLISRRKLYIVGGVAAFPVQLHFNQCWLLLKTSIAQALFTFTEFRTRRLIDLRRMNKAETDVQRHIQ